MNKTNSSYSSSDEDESNSLEEDNEEYIDCVAFNEIDCSGEIVIEYVVSMDSEDETLSDTEFEMNGDSVGNTVGENVGIVVIIELEL